MGKQTEGEDPNRVRVYLRLKPGKVATDPTIYKVAADGKQLCAVNALGHFDRDKWYSFDHIFNESVGNKEVYKLSGQNLVDSVMKGFNCTLFAYGQTGSGKTHTLMSADGSTAYMVSRIFSRISRDPLHHYKVTCSYLQIYQNHVYDLLNSNPNLKLRLREDPNEGMFVENLSTYICYSPHDVYELLNAGRKRLIFAETKMNRYSSRSHAICQLVVSKQSKNAFDNESCNTSISSRCTTPSAYAEIPEINVEMSLSPTPPTSSRDQQDNQQESPPLPFKKPLMKTRHSSPGLDTTLKKDVENAPPCYLSNGKRSRSQSAEHPSHLITNQGRLVETSDTYYHGTVVKTVDAVKTTSKIPLKSKLSTAHNNSTTTSNNRCKTPDSSRSKGRPSVRRSSSSLFVDPGDSFRQRRSLSSSSLRRTTTPVGGKLHNRTPSSAMFDSSESLISDDIRWQMNRSNLDMSQIEDDDELSVFSLDSHTSVDEYVSLRGKLNIVDLAGSERTIRTQVEAEKLREAKHINTSLLELGNVIAALAENKSHIPYRNSELTRLLKDSLGGNCKTSFVLCLSPSMEDFVETQNTLQFGQRLLKLKTRPSVNLEPDYKTLVDELKSKMRESELMFEAKIKEYEEKLSILRSEKNQKEVQLYQQNNLSRLLKDERDSSYTKNDQIKTQLEYLQTEVSTSENLLKEKDVELKRLRLENRQLIKANEELKTNFENLSCKKQRKSQHMFDVGTNTTYNEDDPGYYDQKILEKRNKELHDLSFEYQELLKENEQMRLKRIEQLKRPRDQTTCTSPIHSFDVSTNTESLHTCGNSTNCVRSELERMRNFLLAEVMSLQLLYSMFDFKTKAQVDRESVLSGVKFTSNVREKASSSLSTPSGYETESHSSETTNNVTNEKKALDCFNFLNGEPTDTNEGDDIESAIPPKTGNLLEEIIEAQRSGSCLLSSPDSVKDVPMESRVLFLKKEIGQQKKIVEEEFARVAAQHLGMSEQTGGRLLKREVYNILVKRLSHEEFYKHYTLESLEQILNLVLVDHSLTGCLLALSHKTKTSTLNMIRRLSSYKSTNQKPLLDYTYIDQELYGYENEACNVFHSDDDSDVDQVVENAVDGTPSSFVDILYNDSHVDEFPIETRQIHHNSTAKNFGMLAIDSDNEANSDSDESSPVPQKKGLRRFFCMPKKSSTKAMKKTTSGSSIGSTVRRSFRRSTKKKETSLLDFEQ